MQPKSCLQIRTSDEVRKPRDGFQMENMKPSAELQKASGSRHFWDT
jgi:hypothetical protein